MGNLTKLVTLGVAIFGSTVAQAMPTPGRFDVLGVKLFTTQASARALLIKAGLKPNPSGSYACSPTYEAYIAKKIATKTKADGMPSCQDQARNANSRVTVEYTLTPDGYVVSKIKYNFGSTESAEAIVARLTDKFGAPTDTGSTPIWKSSTSDRGMFNSEPALFYRTFADGTHNVELGAGSNSYRQISDGVNIDLSRRMGSSKVAL